MTETTMATQTDQPADDARDEQSPEDQAAAVDTGVASDEPGSDAGAAGDDNRGGAADEGSEGLITDEQFEALKEHPEKLRAELLKAYTRKTQQLAKERKGLESWSGLIQSLENDTRGTIRALAEQFGLQITDPKEQTTTTQAVEIGDAIMDAVRTSLGEDYADLADKLAPAMRQVAELVAKATTEPLRRQQDELVRDSAERETAAVLMAFGKTHPDWQTYEKDMVVLASKLPPGKGVSEAEYLDMLYRLASGTKSADRKVAEKTKATIQRMERSAKASTSAGGGVGSDKVVAQTSGPISFDEAARLARLGIRVQ